MKNTGIFDFDKDVIYGAQPVRCSLTVEAMREGIKLGHEFQNVKVAKGSDGSYIILEGNHRTSAHYLEKKSLGYIVLLTEESSNCISRSYNIKDKVVGGIDYMRLANSLIYLPKNVARDFCERNNLEEFFGELEKISGQIKICKWQCLEIEAE